MSVSEKRTELFVGLFVFFGLAIMAVLILQFGRFEDGLKEKYSLRVTFPDATGIFEGVDVRLGGVKIGSVGANPRPDAEVHGVVVDLEIFKDFKIPRNAKFSIRTSGLMGDSYIGIQIPDAAEGGFLQSDERVDGQPAADLQALTLTAEELSQQAKKLLTEVTETVQDIRKGVDNLNNALDKFDNNILGDENLDNVKTALANLRETSDTLKESSTKLGPVLDEARTAVSKATATFEGTKDIVAKLGPVVDEFEETAEGVTLAVSRINEGDGLLSALLNDPELKENFMALVSNLRTHGVLKYKDSGAGGETADEASSSGDGPGRKPRPYFNKR